MIGSMHFHQVQSAHKYKSWKDGPMHVAISLLRDDYPTLMVVLGALSDVSV
jgi:hypothetical protein